VDKENCMMIFRKVVEGDFEWFQWIAKWIIEFNQGKDISPAHIAHSEWKPPK